MEQTSKPKRNSPSEVPRITEHDIQKALYANLYFAGWRLFLPNIRLFDWESDYLAFTMDGHIHEFEIKTSRADFLADLRKPKHSRLKNGRFSDYRIPNFYTFVLPVGIIKRYEMPEYAGLMEWEIVDGCCRVHKIRSAKELTPIRACESDYQFLVEKSNEKMIKAWL